MSERTVAYGDKYKCFVEVDVTASSPLDAINKLEELFEDYRVTYTFDIMRCTACKEYLDANYRWGYDND